MKESRKGRGTCIFDLSYLAIIPLLCSAAASAALQRVDAASVLI